ncbi:MAG: fimbrillin family protein [Prevotellaceae bacterium]|nr:fimbrillin family protein [Prevotellaceae bacterium]
MIQKYRYLLLFVLFPVLVGCADDMGLSEADSVHNGELPVEFHFEWPGMTDTRAFDDVNVKTKFGNDDVIHIVGTFKTSALQEDGTYKEGTVSRYGALKYDATNRKWNAVAGSTLTWPSISTEGKFYAYYESTSSGLFTQYDTPIEINLSEVTPQTDPLMAPETSDMPYGHAVHLRFEHLCTYLSLVDLEPMVASQYFFTTPDYKIGSKDAPKDFHNGYRLSLVNNAPESEVPQPALKFEFVQIPDETYEGLIYIAGNATTIQHSDDDEEVKATKVGYFLEPGLYNKFQLSYSSIAPKTYNYLTYDYESIPPQMGGIDKQNTPPDLAAGHTYVLTVTKSPGVTIESPPSGEGWDETDVSYDVEVDEFLKSIREGREYRNKSDILILEAVPGGTRLLHNVDFHGENYEDFQQLGFLPDVLGGRTFDGNYHYIMNLGCSLFRNNYGTIQNLGLKNAVINTTSIEYTYGEEEDNTQDKSRHGALCMWNRSDGIISNVRLENVDMTVSVQYNNDDADGSEVHNIGAVVGSNTGSISELYLSGRFNLTVEGADVQNAEVLIGGLMGQNAGSGTISNVSLLKDDFQMQIMNKCSSALGLYAVGGIAGKSSGMMSGIIMTDVFIDCRESTGLVSYLGGMAGQLEVTGASSVGYMNDCILSGSVQAGKTIADEKIPGQAYTGGMAGYDNNVPVTDCRASVSVIGSQAVSSRVTYGTGGAFGRIFNSSTFENLITYGARLVAPTGTPESDANHIGNFAGIAPEGQSWEKDYADKNIIFHSFAGLEEIGAFLSN